jgi:hypothetical protein
MNPHLPKFSLRCETCDTPKSYSYPFDAYYCKKCNVWLEKNCEHPDCGFCKGRPITPDMIPEDE